MVSRDPYKKRFFKREPSPLRILLLRLLIVVVLLFILAFIFWAIERDSIKDTAGGNFSFFDSLYFTVVTVTTLGYGDIVPVTEGARMFDAFIITPVRMIVWVMFIGTAYQLIIQKYWERFRMKRALSKMKGHVIVTGYGTTGATTVKELLLKGYDENSLVVIDRDEKKAQTAGEDGVTALVGDSTRESVLMEAGIGTAQSLLVTIPHDDTNVLIALTAKDLNPRLKVIARVSQKENVKQLERAGADIVVSPSLTSGNLMAMAVSSSSSVRMMGDLLTTSRGENVSQRTVKSDEVGKRPKELKGMVVIGVISGQKDYGPTKLDGLKLKKGDQLIIIG